MKRAAYVAGLAVSGLAAGVAMAATVIVGGAGVFWLYVFGDDPWPTGAETALVALAYAAGAITAVAVPFTIVLRWRGKRAAT
jgi:hypothetical protein